MFTPEQFFDLSDCAHAPLFNSEEPIWMAIRHLPEYLAKFFQADWALKGFTGLVQEPLVLHNGQLVLDGLISLEMSANGKIEVQLDGVPAPEAAVIMPGAYLYDDRIIIGAGTIVEPGALIKGPTIIGKKCEIRQGAYFRGNCLICDECLVGHATEIKSSIMLKGSKAGHFAYIGDSILGAYVNLGAGTKLANLKMVPGTVTIRMNNGERLVTGLRKLGAIIGDGCEFGCNSVTSPGTFLGKSSRILPCVNLPAGYYPDKTIISYTEESLKIRETTKVS